MCLLFYAINDVCGKDEFRLILANNRDEFWKRPTQEVHEWTVDGSSTVCFSGTDNEAGREGGTWLGASVAGRIACLVNITSRQDPTKQGRGFLVRDFLTTDDSIESYATKIASEKDSYSGFHLTLIELGQSTSNALLVTNDKEHTESVIKLQTSDVQAVGNSPVKPSWCKMCKGRDQFGDIVRSHKSTAKREELKDQLFHMMADKTRHWPDPQLQKQADECRWPPDAIQDKSAILVWDVPRKYGTRTTTLLLVDAQGNCEYVEKTLQTPVDVDNPQWTTKQHHFSMQFRTDSGTLV